MTPSQRDHLRDQNRRIRQREGMDPVDAALACLDADQRRRLQARFNDVFGVPVLHREVVTLTFHTETRHD